jgi:hypothetical protein
MKVLFIIIIAILCRQSLQADEIYISVSADAPSTDPCAVNMDDNMTTFDAEEFNAKDQDRGDWPSILSGYL